MEKISKNVSYKEGTYSQKAQELGIDNTPNAEQLEAMRYVAENVFQKVREHFGKPIRISSFFRCESVNKAVGGSSTSQHCKGEAMDLQAIPGTGITNKMIFDYIKENLVWDQLIDEYGFSWVHVSLKKTSNRKQILKIG